MSVSYTHLDVYKRQTLKYESYDSYRAKKPSGGSYCGGAEEKLIFEKRLKISKVGKTIDCEKNI